MSVTNPDKVVTKQDLKDFYDDILPYLGGNLPVLGTINKSDIYSTTEKVVGCWTDGRPIYQKIVTATMPTCTTDGTFVQTNVALGIPILRFIDCEAWLENLADGYEANIPLPIGALSGTSGAFYFLYNNNGSGTTSSYHNRINLRNGAKAWSGKPVYFNIKYTKTTDAANSFNYASENDYSTTEKIIGTWIDGKKIFQKTLTVSMPQCTTDGTLATTYTSIGATIETVVSARAHGYLAGMLLDFSGCYIQPSQNLLTSNKIKGIFCYVHGNNVSSDKNSIVMCNNSTGMNSATFKVTVQYTKTS